MIYQPIGHLLEVIQWENNLDYIKEWFDEGIEGIFRFSINTTTGVLTILNKNNYKDNMDVELYSYITAPYSHYKNGYDDYTVWNKDEFEKLYVKG
jgi:hypothetical protein